MKQKKPQRPQHQFTERERRDFLYHTSEEMRAINDAADRRLSNDVERVDALEFSVDSTEGKASDSADQR